MQRAPLLEMGAWLETNGEAIYPAQPWHTAGEGRTRFTQVDDVIYAFAMDPPTGEWQLTATIPSAKNSVGLLGCDSIAVERLGDNETGTMLHIDGDVESCGRHVWTFAFRSSAPSPAQRRR